MLDEDEQFFNSSMLEPRLTVEWGFMRVSQLFQAFSKPSTLKSGQMPVAQMYAVAVLLTNLRTCMHEGNLVSKYFDLKPCTPEEYLGLI